MTLMTRLRAPLTRRCLLRAAPAAALALIACAEEPVSGRMSGLATEQVPDQAPRPAATSAPPAPPAPAPTPAPTPAPRPPALVLPSSTVAQGGTFLVVVTGDRIARALVEFAGHTFGMVRERDGLLAVAAVGQAVGVFAQFRPGPYPLRAIVELEGGVPVVLDASVTVEAAEFPVESIFFTPAVAALLAPDVAEQDYAVLRAVFAPVTPARRWESYFRRPSAAALTDVYGSRRSYNGGAATGSHSGVDFGGAHGSPVVAAAHGTVALVQPLVQRGNVVVVDHGTGVYTGYCHLSAFAVEEGQEVAAGDWLGNVGATGLVTGPHLHWDVVVGGMHVDGLRWLAS